MDRSLKLKIAVGVCLTLSTILIIFSKELAPILQIATSAADGLAKAEPSTETFFLLLSLFGIGACFFVPVAGTALVTSLIFPLEWSLIIAVLGVTLAATTTYWVGRLIPLMSILKRLGYAKPMKKGVDQYGFWGVLLLRVAPTPPFTFTSFACGALKLSFLPYLLATVVGILPLVLLIQIVGDRALEIFYQPSLQNISIIGFAIFGFFLLTVIRKKILQSQSARSIDRADSGAISSTQT